MSTFNKQEVTHTHFLTRHGIISMICFQLIHEDKISLMGEKKNKSIKMQNDHFPNVQ